MLEQILRLAGFDLESRVAAMKGRLEDKAQHLFGRVKDEARNFAIGAGLCAAAGVMALLALIAGLMALHQALQGALGPVGALLVIVAVLLLLAVLCAVSGRTAFSKKADPDYLLFPHNVVVTPVILEPVEDPRAGMHRHRQAAGTDQLIATVIAALGRFFPLTDVLRYVTGGSQRTMREAARRAAGLVQTGSRPALLGVLGGAVLVGYLIARRRADREQEGA